MRRALRVYFSAPTARAPELLVLARELEGDGLAISSSWLWRVVRSPALHPHAPDAGGMAVQDLRELRASDVCLVFAKPPVPALGGAAPGGAEPARAKPSGRGGRHVELGIAIERGLHIVVYGEPEHIFHALPSIWVSRDWTAVRQRLRKLARREVGGETLEDALEDARGKTSSG